MIKSIFFMVFLASLIVCPAALSQTPETGLERNKEAIQLDSFGRLSNGDLRGRFDMFLTEIFRGEKGTKGVVVIYGTVREVEARKRLVENHVAFRRFDKTSVTYVRGGNVSEFRTDLWIIPSGADGPKLEPEAFIVGEIGKATKTTFVSMVKRVFREVANNPSYQTYIINYGISAEIARREKWLVSEIAFRNFDRSRITIVRGGRKTGPRTVFWMAPPGAASPPA